MELKNLGGGQYELDYHCVPGNFLGCISTGKFGTYSS